MTTTEIPEGMRRLFDEFTTVEGEVLAELGMGIEAITEFAREIEHRGGNQLLVRIYQAGREADRETIRRINQAAYRGGQSDATRLREILAILADTQGGDRG